MANGVVAVQPLPNIEKKPRIAGVVGTIAFWALFLAISVVFSLFARKPVYKTVQIRLDSPQAKTQEARAAAPKATESVAQAAPSQPSAPAQAQPTASAQSQPQQTARPAQTPAPAASKPTQSTAKPQTSAKPTSVPKPTTPKTTAPSAETFETEFYDPMEQFYKNTAQKATATADTIDWNAVTANSSADSNTVSQNAQTNTVTNALGGSAATSSGTNTTASATSQNKSASQAASNGTNAMLSKIAATAYTKASGNGVSSTATVKTGGTADGKVTVQMSDGTTRALLEPPEPSITLSRAAALLVDSKKQVQIRFTVTANGTVPVSEIRITPESILHPEVRREITAQISKWRFSAADAPGQAVFDYTISVQ